MARILRQSETWVKEFGCVKVSTIEQTLVLETFSLGGEVQEVCCAADQFIHFTLSDDGDSRSVPLHPATADLGPRLKLTQLLPAGSRQSSPYERRTKFL